MALVQGILWCLHVIIHVFALGPLTDMINARRAIKLGIGVKCTCEPCSLKKNLKVLSAWQRAKAVKKCKAACNKKCPIKCPLKQFDNETNDSYDRRCRAAISLALGVFETKTSRRKIRSNKDLLEALAEDEDIELTERKSEEPERPAADEV